MYWMILVAANLPLYVGVGKVIFGSFGEFWECLKFWLTPDVISIFRGEWEEDMWAELKMLCFVLACAVLVWGEHWVIQKWW